MIKIGVGYTKVRMVPKCRWKGYLWKKKPMHLECHSTGHSVSNAVRVHVTISLSSFSWVQIYQESPKVLYKAGCLPFALSSRGLVLPQPWSAPKRDIKQHFEPPVDARLDSEFLFMLRPFPLCLSPQMIPTDHRRWRFEPVAWKALGSVSSF